MSILTLGAGIAGIHGSVGGTTYRSNPTTTTSSKKPRKHKVISPWPKYIPSAAQSWANLTQANRDAWNAAAIANTILFGSFTSGYNAFVAYWLFAQYGAGNFAANPFTSGYPIRNYDFSSTSNSLAADTVDFAWTEPLHADDFIALRGTIYYFKGSRHSMLSTNIPLEFYSVPTGSDTFSWFMSGWDTLNCLQAGDVIRLETIQESNAPGFELASFYYLNVFDVNVLP